MALAKRAAYIASKGAVYSLTRAMQADYCRYNIRVNSLLPGTIYTPFVEGFLRRHYADNIEAATNNLKKAPAVRNSRYSRRRRLRRPLSSVR